MNVRQFLLLGVLVIGSLTGPNISNAATETVRIYGEVGDGRLGTGPYPGSWVTQHADTTGRLVEYTQDVIHVKSGAFYSPTGYLTIDRGFLVFDTSTIPQTAQITNVKLGLFVTDKFDQFNDQYGYVSVLQGFQQSTDFLVADDIETCGDVLVNPSKGSSDFDITDLTLDQYQEFVLNNTGVTWIMKGGYTKLCIREGHDIENVATEKISLDGGSWATNSWDRSGLEFASADASNPDTRPYIEVTYEVVETETTRCPLHAQIKSPHPSEVGTAGWEGEVLPEEFTRDMFVALVAEATADESNATQRFFSRQANRIFDAVDAGREGIALIRLRVFEVLLSAKQVSCASLNQVIEELRESLREEL